MLGITQSASAGARVAGPILGNVLLTHVATGAPFAMGAAVFGVALLVAWMLP